MTDARTINLPRRTVRRSAVDNLYYIYYWTNQEWLQVEGERGYPHSTSCYARLGRIVAHESLED